MKGRGISIMTERLENIKHTESLFSVVTYFKNVHKAYEVILQYMMTICNLPNNCGW